MAGRPKKESTEETIVEEKEVDLKAKLEEKDNELSQMKTMMLQMQQQILAMSQQNFKSQEVKLDEYVPVYKTIPVMSLYDGMLNLSTGINGQGKITTFTRFGEVRKIPYGDLRDMISSNFNFAKDGLFYVMDNQVVVETGLEEYYKNIMTKEQIESIIEIDKNAILDTFSAVTPSQKEVIVDIITRKMAHGEEFDLNKISIISDSIGKDIKEMAKDLKFSLGEKL